MTVLSVNGPLVGSREMSVDINGVKSATLVYKVVTDGAMHLPAILADPLLAVVGGTYPDNPDMYIGNVSLRDTSDNVIAYDLTLEYTNARDLATNPLLEPARISFSSEFYQVPAFFDRYGEALVTSSGEYPEGLYEDAVQLNLQISKNVLTIPSWFTASQGATNIAPFTVRGLTFPAETCRLSGVNASDEFTRNGFIFYKLGYSIAYRQKGWRTEYMDRGYYKKDPADATKRIKILLDDGQLPSSPVPLDGSGGVLSDPKPSNIIVFQKDTKPALDFNTLPLS